MRIFLLFLAISLVSNFSFCVGDLYASGVKRKAASEDLGVSSGLKKTVAVFDFQNDSGYNSMYNLGEDFSHLLLDGIFQENLTFLTNLSLYPMFLIIVISILAILSLYNYQKAGIMEKAKDFLCAHVTIYSLHHQQ